MADLMFDRVLKKSQCERMETVSICPVLLLLSGTFEFEERERERGTSRNRTLVRLNHSTLFQRTNDAEFI
jgi:hypothetical protein